MAEPSATQVAAQRLGELFKTPEVRQLKMALTSRTWPK